MKKLKKAYVEITNRCNKNCSFCHCTKRAPRDMTLGEFERVLDQLQDVTEYIYLHVLGEPLLHHDVKEMIKAANDRGFKVSLTTNGTLLSDSLLESDIYKVQISLHSFEDENESEHIKYLEEIVRFSKMASKRGTLVSLRLWNLNTDVSNSLAEKILAENFPKPWKEGRGSSFTLYDNIFLNYAQRFEWPDISGVEKGEKVFCYGLRDQIGILSDGSVVPCCLDADGAITLGNVFASPLDEILSSPRARAIYDGFSNRVAVEELCRKCPYAQRFNIK